jgi:hypothetical protein
MENLGTREMFFLCRESNCYFSVSRPSNRLKYRKFFFVSKTFTNMHHSGVSVEGEMRKKHSGHK